MKLALDANCFIDAFNALSPNYYVNGRQLIAAAVNLADRFTVTDRRVLAEGNFVRNYVHANYDVT